MSGGPAAHGRSDSLYVPGRSVLHRLAPEAKVAGTLAFVVVVALTPRWAVGAFGVDAAAVAAVAAVAGLPVRLVLARLSVVVPFLLVAALVPFVAGGEQVTVGGITLSVAGSWGAWNIAVKAVLGATASIVLAATTPVPDLLRGLARLRVPASLVSIVAVAVRYLDLVVDQLGRTRAAMAARGHDPRWLWQARPLAASAGALFVRTYERGERTHQAMLARGFEGTMPALDGPTAALPAPSLAFVPAATAAAALVVAVVA